VDAVERTIKARDRRLSKGSAQLPHCQLS